jgi:hypothetical protein
MAFARLCQVLLNNILKELSACIAVLPSSEQAGIRDIGAEGDADCNKHRPYHYIHAHVYITV